MKTLIISFVIVLSMPLLIQAQYAGGPGRGDVSHESPQIPLGIEMNNSIIPAADLLQQNSPNPFTTITNIKCNIAIPGEVKILVYDFMGCEVKTLINGSLQRGEYSIPFDGSSFRKGIYFYKIFAGEFSETKRMLLWESLPFPQ